MQNENIKTVVLILWGRTEKLGSSIDSIKEGAKEALKAAKQKAAPEATDEAPSEAEAPSKAVAAMLRLSDSIESMVSSL